MVGSSCQRNGGFSAFSRPDYHRIMEGAIGHKRWLKTEVRHFHYGSAHRLGVDTALGTFYLAIATRTLLIVTPVLKML